MERSFQAAMLLHDPEVVFVLGEYNNVNDSFDFGCVTQLLLCFVLCLYFYCSVCVQLNVTVRWSCVLPVLDDDDDDRRDDDRDDGDDVMRALTTLIMMLISVVLAINDSHCQSDKALTML